MSPVVAGVSLVLVLEDSLVEAEAGLHRILTWTTATFRPINFSKFGLHYSRIALSMVCTTKLSAQSLIPSWVKTNFLFFHGEEGLQFTVSNISWLKECELASLNP